MINIKKLLPILTFCLFCLNCEQGWLEDIIDPTVLGCNVNAACNYDPDVNENDGTCEFLSCKDCLGYPHGIAVLDSCGTCDASLLNDCIKDCDGTWGGTAITDNCENCSTSSIACEVDCMGTWGGSAVVDSCAVCDGGTFSINDCSICDTGLILGCDGICSVTPTVNDVCDICGGDGSTCKDCAGTVNGSATVDQCGTCDTNSSNDCLQDCNGIWGGSAVEDNCGICGGNNTDCTDCLGVVGGTATIDCAGVCNGDAYIDDCGVCDSDSDNDCIIENYSLEFDGVDDYIQLSSSVRVGTAPITVMFRAKTDSYSVTAGMDIISQACDNDNNDCDGDFRLQFSASYLQCEGVSFLAFESHIGTYPFNVGDNKWHNYAYVFGENGDYSYSNIKVYVDGYEISFNCGHNWGGWNYSLPDIPMTIGKKSWGHNGNYFSGYIYNVAVFSKSLSMEMVQEYVDYSFSGNENDLVGYWNFNEGSGTNIFDLTGNENHGIINGANWTICDDNNYDCVNDYDCSGVLGGSAVIDDCGVCDGSGGYPNCEGAVVLWGEVFQIDQTTRIDFYAHGQGLPGTVIPPEIGNLVNLTSIDLAGNGLIGSIPPEIGNLTNLEYLRIGQNDITGEIPSEIGNLVNLNGLYLSDNNLTGGIPSEIGNLVNLTELRLNGNNLSGSIPSEIGNLINLQHLHISQNDFSGSIPSEIGNLTNLQQISLQDCKLTGSIPESIGNLANLIYLGLYNNQLSGQVPENICDIYSDLNNFNLTNNNLCPPYPSCLTEEDIGTQDISACPVQDCAGTWGGTEPDTDGDGICDNLQGTVSDVDGNTYKTIKIGEQWWMTENLNTSKYRDETSIPEEQDGDIDGVDAGSDYWTGLITGAWSYYNNDSANGEVYGKIYNWYAVNGDINGDGTKDKELCPQGWHVPSSSEFTTLIDYLGGSHSAYTSLKDGGNSGFNAISVPFRFGCGGSSCNNGGFGINSNYDRSFWAATSVDELSGYYLRIDTSDTPATSVVWSNNKHGGKSVRCLKD